jgi:hypothetical protein
MLYSKLKKARRHLWLAAMVAFAGLTSARAGDLFELRGTSPTVGGGTPISVGGSELLDLVESFVGRENEFAAFAGANNYRGNLRYADVPNAIIIIRNDTPTAHVATILIPSTGLNRSFSATTTDDLNEQIRNFVKTEGAEEWARFLREVNRRSKVSPVDGNPDAATARAATQTFMQFGFEEGLTREERDSGENPNDRTSIGFTADVGRFNAGGQQGTTYSLPLYARYKLTDRVGLHFNIPLNWTRLEGADIYGVGLNVGLPIKIFPRSKDNPLFWQLTPSAGVNGSGSVDMIAGGLLANGGLTSLLSYDFDRFTVSMGNHFSYHEALSMNFDSVKFDSTAQQEILKNGLKVSIPFAKRWIFDIYGLHTKFLEDAAVDQYFTVGGEVGFRFSGKGAKKRSGYTKLGFYADLSDDYNSAHAQFGTSWKF